jgi:phage virion morphogenesis protein
VKITVKYDDAGARAFITGLEGRLKSMVPALKQIGEHMLRVTEERFSREQAPDGSKWAPLKPSTLRRKKGPKILTESNELRGGIRWQLVGTTAIAIGTNKPYGRIHQLGGKAGRGRKTTIPARPYLGISSADQDEIAAIVIDNILARGRARKGR